MINISKFYLFNLFILINIGLLSCGKKKKNVERFPNGNIKWEGTYIGDSVKEGKFKEYYETGGVKTTGTYKNNKKDSVEIEYWETGIVKGKLFYRDNFLTDTQTLYYPRGNVLAKYFWSNGKRIGGAYTFYANGKVREYSFNSLNEQLVYRIIYDLSGEIESEEGDLTPIINFNMDILRVGDTFKSEIYVITPPGFQFELITGHIDKDGEFIKEDTLLINNGKSFFNKTAKYKQDYHWKLLYKVYTTKGDLKEYSNDLNVVFE